ncbi:endonuclease domain-containing protein [candidate division WOR-3 bacterium]|nr:endonuclease domain-containing protein [candidate division WOR-3 bacterium]
MTKHPLPPEVLKRCRELRASQIPAEARLWNCLRNGRLLGLKFRRQHSIGKFIVDFDCHKARLAIELDGGGHVDTEQAEYDKERSGYLETLGIKVLSFWNPDVIKSMEDVIEAIIDAVPSPIPPHP